MNCKSFLITEAERKHVRRRARFQQHGDASCHQVFFLLQGKAQKEIHAILTETLGEHAPSFDRRSLLPSWKDLSAPPRMIKPEIKLRKKLNMLTKQSSLKMANN